MSDEKIAIVALGTSFPDEVDRKRLSSWCREARPDFSEFPFKGLGSRSFRGLRFSEIKPDFRRYGIPPIYLNSTSTTTFLMLQAVDDAVGEGAKCSLNGENLDRVDVVCGTSFGFDSTYRNWKKISALRSKAAIHGDTDSFQQAKADIVDRYGVNSHDRVGEMASSLPARLASFLKVRGKCQTIDNLDATGVSVLLQARDTLLQNDSDVVIAVTAQRVENALMPESLYKKGLKNKDSSREIDYPILGEGACCLVLKRLSSAIKDKNKIVAVVDSVHIEQTKDKKLLKYNNNYEKKIITLLPLLDSVEENSTDLVLTENLSDSTQLMLSKAIKISGIRADEAIQTAQALGYQFANTAFSGLAVGCHSLEEKRSSDEVIVTGSSLSGTEWSVGLRRLKIRENISISDYVSNNEPIAIVGMSGIAGQDNTISSIWKSLISSVDSIKDVNTHFNDWGIFHDKNSMSPLSTYSDKASFTPRKIVDNEKSKLPLRKTKTTGMDDVQVLALKCAIEAYTDSNVKIKPEAKSAVIIASNLCLVKEREMALQFMDCDLDESDNIQPITPSSYDGFSASNISYNIADLFSLDAECYCVEAACASSLASINNAVMGLRQNRFDIVVAGGFELPVNIKDLVLCSAQMMLSKDKISPFSDDADGFSAGDGGGIFILKRLSDATEDGDNVIAVIEGISGSCDARSMTSPDPMGQKLAIEKAFSQTKIDFNDVQYIEAHGTGTVLGDRAEIDAIKATYGARKRNEPLYIGSIKSNYGHCFSGAGSLGTLKTVLAIENQVIPPTIMRGRVNSELKIEDIPAKINTELVSWGTKHQKAAVSSFGTGGINYHLILGRTRDEL